MGDQEAKETMFQFARLADGKGEFHRVVSSYQERIGEGSDLEYNQASAFYYASLRENDRTLCSPTVFARLEQLAQKTPTLSDTLRLVRKFETFAAPEV